jgi:DNA-binding MarR family transcriptional regulator
MRPSAASSKKLSIPAGKISKTLAGSVPGFEGWWILDRAVQACQYVYMHVNETPGRVALTKLEEVARACACANLRKAARVVTQLFDGVLAPSGLKATQFTLLVTSRLMGEAPVGELAGTMAMDRTTLSRNLKPLVREGLLEVRPGEDGRTRLVKVTPEGERALAGAYPLWKSAQEAVVTALGSDRFEALLGDTARAVSLATDSQPRAPAATS